MKFFKSKSFDDKSYWKLQEQINKGIEEYAEQHGENPDTIILTNSEFDCIRNYYEHCHKAYDWAGLQSWEKKPIIAGMIILIDPSK